MRVVQVENAERVASTAAALQRAMLHVPLVNGATAGIKVGPASLVSDVAPGHCQVA